MLKATVCSTLGLVVKKACLSEVLYPEYEVNAKSNRMSLLKGIPKNVKQYNDEGPSEKYAAAPHEWVNLPEGAKCKTEDLKEYVKVSCVRKETVPLEARSCRARARGKTT